MRESEKKQLLDLLCRLTRALGEALGKNCEVVLHDLSDNEHSIIAIANNHITGRKQGDTMDVLGFQLLRNPPKEDLFNYKTTTKNGKVLCSSSVFLRDENGEIVAALCINQDISPLVKLQEWVQDTLGQIKSGPTEEFECSVEEVFERLIKDAVRSTGKEIPDLTREDKVAVIAYLESRGAFLIRYSMDRAAEVFGLSKYTIYNYLEELKTREAGRSDRGSEIPLSEGSTPSAP